MFRLVLKSSFFLCVWALALVVGVRVLPYDHHSTQEIRAQLFPPGCEAPCLMGIHPGATTLAEVQTVLTTSAWVEQTTTLTLSEHVAWVQWTWNPRAFPFDKDGERNAITTFDGVVSGIMVDTDVAYGNILLMLEESPQRYASTGIGRPLTTADHILVSRNMNDVGCAPTEATPFEMPTSFAINQDIRGFAHLYGDPLNQTGYWRWLHGRVVGYDC
jgi:hypothetical protein